MYVACLFFVLWVLKIHHGIHVVASLRGSLPVSESRLRSEPGRLNVSFAIVKMDGFGDGVVELVS